MSLRSALVVVVLLVVLPGRLAAQTQRHDELAPSAAEHQQLQKIDDVGDVVAELRREGPRLLLAAGLGTALALRPRRRGTPPRRTPVVQTQIVLAIVGAVVMLIVGESLARAFGIVGIASLIRYRSKINDPKDAVVMLSALAVGLAAGAGFYVLAAFSTLFLVAALGVIESFEPQTRSFELSVKLGDKTMTLRSKIEAALRRLKVKYELRGVSEEAATYLVTAPAELRTDEASKALTALVPDDKGAVEWHEVSKMKVK